jgi:GntR family transcriptional regulator, transcriptional repressor for pyruvate dehydrogenase complex
MERGRQRGGQLPDRLVTRIISAVAAGEHVPGGRLPPEDELARRYSVSRLTLREGVKVLRDKGVLRVEQGRGTFVNPPGEWSVLDPELLAARSAIGAEAGVLATKLTEARRVVEVGVAELAAARRTDADLDRMAEAISRMREANARDDVGAFSVADVAFHDALNRAADNPFLSALFEPIATLVHEVRRSTSASRQRRVAAIGEHERILAAVTAGSPAQAWAAASEHLDRTGRVIDEVLAGKVAAAPDAGDRSG